MSDLQQIIEPQPLETKAKVKMLINNWNTSNTAAIHRDELRKMAKASGKNLADYIEYVFAVFAVAAETQQPQPDLLEELGHPTVTTPLRDFANMILADGYKAENMNDPERAVDWIETMAQGWQDEHDLNEQGEKFWKVVRSKYGVWRIKRDRDNSKLKETPHDLFDKS